VIVLNEVVCHYHKDRSAVKKCEDCGVSICLDCSRIYSITHSGDENSHSYTEKKDVCFPCYCNRIEQTGAGGFLFMIFFGLVFAGIAFGMTTMVGGFAPPIFSLVTILFVVVGLSFSGKGIKELIQLPEKKEQIRREREEFFRNLSSSDFQQYKRPEIENPPTARFRSIPKNGVFYCQQCGGKIAENARFCPYCGDSTDDERAIMK
jgi:uncharacterized membrane protein